MQRSQSQEADVLKNLGFSNKIVVNLNDTQYQVVRDVCKFHFKWKLQYEKINWKWDLLWTDSAVQAISFSKMEQHQKINHFPGMFTLARKNYLARNLMRLQRILPEEYNFFPQTWLLPSQFIDLKNHIQNRPKGKVRTYIAKPEASSQGRGIFLTRWIQSFEPKQHYVVQRYMHKPMLIEGLKFDFRIYVLVAGCDPLRLYIYNEGLARLATEKYQSPNPQNLQNLCMHLTNYAINKDNQNFVFNKSQTDMAVGHKRSLTSVMGSLRQAGIDTDRLNIEIKQIIIKTLIAGQPFLAHHYRTCQSDNLANDMCFQILGFDIILDHKGKPYLLQVNHSPSFTTDTPLDKHIKESLIRDSLRLVNLSVSRRREVIEEAKLKMKERMITGKKVKFSAQQRSQQIERLQEKRDKYQSKNKGNFEKIYPSQNQQQMSRYKSILQQSLQVFHQSTGQKKKLKTKLYQTRVNNNQSKLLRNSIISQSIDKKLNLRNACAKILDHQILITQNKNSQHQLPPVKSQQTLQGSLTCKQQSTEEKSQASRWGVKSSGNFLQPKIFRPLIAQNQKGGKVDIRQRPIFNRKQFL